MALKNPLPTETQNSIAIKTVDDGVDDALPVGPPGTVVGDGMYPQPGDTADAFRQEGVTAEQILAANLQVLGYQGSDGTYAGNAGLRTWGYTNMHPPISQSIADCLSAGLPIPPKSSYVPPALDVTFSETAIKSRLLENPPRRYDGYKMESNETNRGIIATSILKMAGDSRFAGISPEVRETLARSFWGWGQEYFPAGFDLAWASGKTAAEIFYHYDKVNSRQFPNGPTE